MPRILYLVAAGAPASGQAYAHVAALVAGGYPAAVATPGATVPAGLPPTVPVIDRPVDSADLVADDVLVAPADDPGWSQELALLPHRKYALCESPERLHLGLAGAASFAAYGARAVLCTSQYAQAFCARRMPGLPAHRLPAVYDLAPFACPAQKRLQVAFWAPEAQVAVLQDLFVADHPAWRGNPWVAIADPWAEASALAEAAIFVAAGEPGETARATLAALASGCLVVGTAGVAMPDFATAANGFWVPPGEALAAADALGQAVALAAVGGAPYQARVAAGLATARAHGAAITEAMLTAFWRQEKGPDHPAGPF